MMSLPRPQGRARPWRFPALVSSELSTGDERGAGEWIEGPRRGGPKDFLDASLASDATLVIPTK